MELSRRSFLKLCATTSVAAAFPSLADATLIDESKEIPKNYTHVGYIRELRQYDVMHGAYIYRYDMSDGKNQIGIDVMQTANAEADKKARQEALRLLLKEAKKKLDMNNLVKLKG